ncbi:MAG TPA: YceD family protein [Pseudogracilibacillus sp.]|nr:YceD family protein [Pseudogracilibacillus sp.]
MEKLHFSVKEIFNTATIEPVYFSSDVDVSELEKEPSNDIIRIGDVHVHGMYTVDEDNDEIIFSFSIDGEMILPCARTLVDVPYPFSFQASEVFTTQTLYEESEDEEEEIHQILTEMLDLTPYIKENIILGTPYRVFSDEEPLAGGDGWGLYQEEEYEEEKRKTVDPRLEKLQQFFGDDQEDKK